MTHLYIELTESSTEEVSSGVIKKLYDMALAGLDSTSNLKGTLHTTVASISHVEYLENRFSPNLHITADEYGLSFEDSTVEQLCINNWGSNGVITVNLIRSVSSIGQVFKNNTSITKFNEFSYFTGVSATNWGLFAGCTNLTEVTLPNSVTTITDYAFLDCKNLSSINLNNINTINLYGFLRCGLTSLTFSGSVDIGPQGCDAMPNLTSVTFNGDVTGTKFKMFSGCPVLSTVTFNSIVTELPEAAFIGCPNITSLDLSNVLSFNSGGSQFNQCSGVTSIIFNNSLTFIPHGFLAYGGNVTFTIPASVTDIEDQAFLRTSTTITCLGTTPPTLGGPNALGSVVSIKVPASAVETYKAAQYWSLHAAKISAIPT